MLAYVGVSTYAATLIVQQAPKPITRTPAALGLAFRPVTFPSRIDGVQLKGWYIPGVLPTGQLTTQRTLIVVHGKSGNRADPSIGLLDLTGDFARQGFGVLAFDMQGAGDSPPAPLALGYFEYRDVLGAVDFLRSGPVPYPQLGRPKAIAGWGISMGGVSMLLAAAQEPAIQAVVADSAYPDMAPILEREIPRVGHLPAFFTPGVLLAARALYGINFYDIRPVDVVSSLAPRPLFLIQADHDDFNPPTNLGVLTRAASAAPNAHVQSWLVPGVNQHAQEFDVYGAAYVQRVVTFYDDALGPDTSAAA